MLLLFAEQPEEAPLPPPTIKVDVPMEKEAVSEGIQSTVQNMVDDILRKAIGKAMRRGIKL